jgi:hypothetical protein
VNKPAQDRLSSSRWPAASLRSTAHEGIGKLFAHAHPPPVAQAAAKDGKRLKELLEHDRQQGRGAQIYPIRAAQSMITEIVLAAQIGGAASGYQPGFA